MSTCRFCKETIWDSRDEVYYATRHYAHHECYLKAGKSLEKLPAWQIRKFPYFLLRDYGVVDQAAELTRYIDS